MDAMLNLDAPVLYQGRKWTPKYRSLPFELSLTGSQEARNNRITMFGDGPFLLQTLTYVSTGAFKIKLYDGSDKAWTLGQQGGSSDYVRIECIAGDGSLPFLFDPQIVIPVNGLIGFDLLELTTSTNLVNLLFGGAVLLPAE